MWSCRKFRCIIAPGTAVAPATMSAIDMSWTAPAASGASMALENDGAPTAQINASNVPDASDSVVTVGAISSIGPL